MNKNQSIGIGCIIVLFILVASLSTVTVSFASIQSNSSAETTNGVVLPSGSSTHFPVGPTIDHIEKAQAALQNGDIETAQSHLDLAKQTLEEFNRHNVKPVNPDIVP